MLEENVLPKVFFFVTVNFNCFHFEQKKNNNMEKVQKLLIKLVIAFG